MKTNLVNSKTRKGIPLVHVDIGFLADDVGETPSNTFDGSKSEHDLLLPVNICIKHTQNVLEIFVRYQRLNRRSKIKPQEFCK